MRLTNGFTNPGDLGRSDNPVLAGRVLLNEPGVSRFCGPRDRNLMQPQGKEMGS
jgi:hypothetical protein